MSIKVILIRHGQTDWSLQKRYCSFTDIGLNKKGVSQARQLSKILSKEEIHKVYSSDMKRTLQFAKIIFKDMPIEELLELREMNFGMFEGLTHQEIMDKYSKIYRRWLDNPLDVILPAGESLNSLVRRTRKALVKILTHNDNRTVAVFTHAGPLRVILCDVLKLDLKEIWRIKPDLASMSIIEFIKGRGKVHLLNKVSYLNG